MKISVCIPMYNEAKVIANTAKTLQGYMSSHFDDYEILFSNDGSTDGCDKIVRDLDLPGVRVVGYEQNHGKGCAVRTAINESVGDVVIFTDSDLAYGTNVIGTAVKHFEENKDCDLLIGSRNISKDGYESYTAVRKLASKVYIKFICLACGFKQSDSQCGFKAFSKDAAHKIFGVCKTDGFAFDLEVIMRAVKYGMKIDEMPVKIINHGESKIRLFRDTFGILHDARKIKRMIRKEGKAEKKK